MKRLVAALAVIVVMSISTTANAAAVAFSFTNNPGSNIVFPGDSTFSFVEGGTGFDFTTSFGNQGLIQGVFTIGPGAVSAPVSGVGTFIIEDGATDFTADVEWIDITHTGLAGDLNTTATVNLTNFSYAGANPILQQLAANGEGISQVAFFILGAPTLDTLRDPPSNETFAYLGSVTSIPEPTTMALAASGLIPLGLMYVRRLRAGAAKK